MEAQEYLFIDQARSNAFRILTKITQVHGGEFFEVKDREKDGEEDTGKNENKDEPPSVDSQIAKFTSKHRKLFESLGSLEDNQIQKLEKDIEDSKTILAGSEFCETLQAIAWHFEGICKKIKVIENTRALQKQIKVALKLMNQAAGKNQELRELYRFWYVQELARKLRRNLENSPNQQLFMRIVVGCISSGLVRLLTSALFDAAGILGDIPPWLSGLLFIVGAFIGGYLIGNLFNFCLSSIADSS